VGADIESTHCLEPFRVLESNLEVDLGNLKAIIDEVYGLVLLLRNRRRWRLDTEYCAFFETELNDGILLLSLFQSSPLGPASKLASHILAKWCAHGICLSARVHHIAGKVFVSNHINTYVMGPSKVSYAFIRIEISTSVIGSRQVSVSVFNHVRMVVHVLGSVRRVVHLIRNTLLHHHLLLMK